MAKKKTGGSKTSTQPVMLKSGMMVQPKEQITPGMTRRWKFASECTPIYGSLMPSDRFRVVEIGDLLPNESMIDVAGGAGAARGIIDIPIRPRGFVVIKQMNGSTQLKLSGAECRNHFIAAR